MVGGQDELVFDGDSIVVSAEGDVIARSPQFVDDLLVVDLELAAATSDDSPDIGRPGRSGGWTSARRRSRRTSRDPLQSVELARGRGGDLRRAGARAAGLRAQERVPERAARASPAASTRRWSRPSPATRSGPTNVYGVSNPSDWSTPHSVDDAAELARRTGLHLDTIPIGELFEAFQKQLSLDGIAEENLQARIRAVIWMGLSNQHGHLVLACGNKSELSVGYSTLYGDAVGGYAPLKDVPKTLVWKLARVAQRLRRRAAASSRRSRRTRSARPPSAELRPGQLDTDSLPDYALLDDILDDYVEQDRSAADLVAQGFDPEVVTRVLGMVDHAEYKRRQYPPGPEDLPAQLRPRPPAAHHQRLARNQPLSLAARREAGHTADGRPGPRRRATLEAGPGTPAGRLESNEGGTMSESAETAAPYGEGPRPPASANRSGGSAPTICSR